MTQKHTPGPWDINGYNLTEIIKIKKGPDHQGRRFIDGRHQERIAIAMGEDHYTWGERYANTRLIAAAPQLLEALKLIMDDFDNTYDGLTGISMELYEAHNKARAAIAKAEAA